VTGGATRPTSTASLGLRERRQLERDLHDGAQQRLVSLSLTRRLAREKLDAESGETGRLLRSLRNAERGQGTIVRARLPSPEPTRDRGLSATVSAPDR
jgi:signal transduction histidine kinase